MGDIRSRKTTKTTSGSSKRTAKYLTDDQFLEQKGQFGLSAPLRFKNVELTDKQKQLHELIKKNKIIVATGPAGTAKTFTACYSAIKLLEERFCEKIILCKPTEIVGNTSLGYLKGDLDDKLLVYKESFISNFMEILYASDVEMLQKENIVEFKPVQFIRGATFNNKVVIIDEFQSFDIKELMAIVTRLGKRNCKMVFIGDISQSDIAKRYVAVKEFTEILYGINGVATFEFEKKDIVRDPIIIEITDRYEKMKELAALPKTKGDK